MCGTQELCGPQEFWFGDSGICGNTWRFMALVLRMIDESIYVLTLSVEVSSLFYPCLVPEGPAPRNIRVFFSKQKLRTSHRS